LSSSSVHVAQIRTTPSRADSIRSIGPGFYDPDVVEAWGSGLTPELYIQAMDGGEAFFIATGELDGKTVVLGFATHRVDGDQTERPSARRG
jgi:hypothetical protein